VSRLLWLVQDLDKAHRWQARVIPLHRRPGLGLCAKANPSQAFHSHFANVSADFLQPIDSFKPFDDFLKRKGPGVFSLLYPVASAESFEAEKTRLAVAGFPLLFEFAIPHPGGASVRYAFFDTAAEGKYVLGLVLAPASLEQNVPRGMKVAQFAFVVRELEPVSAFWTAPRPPCDTYTK